MQFIIVLAIVFPLLILPWILTVLNIVNLFKENKVKENLVDILIFILGIIYTITLYCFNQYKPYTEQLSISYGQSGGFGFFHEPIATISIPTIIFLMAIAILGYAILRTKKTDLPPLAIVLCISTMIIGSIINILWIIQIFKNIKDSLNIFYILFPINYIMCSIRICREVIFEYQQKEVKERKYKNVILDKCSKILKDSSNWPVIAIILTIPTLIVITIILVLFGQRPDELIKAFTETSDWTLSTKVSPPPLEYDAHYLCTVSLKGHEKLVKPLRFGIRKGHTIVVNRQLCVANAFEDYIQEKLPKTHHFIRYIYDKYGYPIAKHIKTAKAADITYLIMKPLEYFFVIFLYLFDTKPENRINIQYIPNKKEILNKSKMI